MSYTIVENDFIEIEDISDGAFRLYVVLKKMCYGDKDSCFPSQEYLSNKLGKSIRTIQRYIDELIEYGVVIKKRRGSISNIYVLSHKVTVKEGKENYSSKGNSRKVVLSSYIYNEKAKIDIKTNKDYCKSKTNDKNKNYKVASLKNQKKNHHFDAYEQRKYNTEYLEAMLLGEIAYDENLLYVATTSNCD